MKHIRLYWAEAGEDQGYCYAVHEDGAVDSAIIPGGDEMTEASAYEWLEAHFPGVPITIGADDIV